MADMVPGKVDAKSGEQVTFEAVFQSMLDLNGRYRPRKVCVEDMTRKKKPISVSIRPRATLNEKLDEALDESFPASDPVSLGHSERIGQPKQKRPKGAVGLKGKR